MVRTFNILARDQHQDIVVPSTVEELLEDLPKKRKFTKKDELVFGGASAKSSVWEGCKLMPIDPPPPAFQPGIVPVVPTGLNLEALGLKVIDAGAFGKVELTSK